MAHSSFLFLYQQTENKMTGHNYFERAELLFGAEAMQKLQETRVAIFGIGGVGSWCAESLVRTGVGHLTLVDYDCVCESNVNRQAMATAATVGQPKTTALKAHLQEINPNVDIAEMPMRYSEETESSFDLNSYDYVVDAIDNIADKALLIRRTCEARAVLLSSMGAALKSDPTKIAVAEFWKVKGCPLAAALRRRFKKANLFPAKKFKCVYSEEQPIGRTATGDASRLRVNGSIVHVTAIFGFTLAGLLVNDVRRESLI